MLETHGLPHTVNVSKLVRYEHWQFDNQHLLDHELMWYGRFYCAYNKLTIQHEHDVLTFTIGMLPVELRGGIL